MLTSTGKIMKLPVWLLTIVITFSYAQDALLMENTEESYREKELERVKLNKKYDKHKLREKTDFVSDTSQDFLVETKGQNAVGEFTVANVPPTVKMRIIPDMTPEYFLEGNVGEGAYMYAWANWARVTRSGDNRFYFSVSDHRGEGCHINIYEYCPARNVVHKVVDFGKVAGWTEKSLTDGKIHGHMGITPDGNLWATTHYGVEPDSSWFANGYRGSWLISYNIYTHETKNWGVPLVGNALPCFQCRYQTRNTLRNRLEILMPRMGLSSIKRSPMPVIPPTAGYGGGERCSATKRPVNSGRPRTATAKNRFISFDPEFNKFEKYDISPPPNPYNNNVNCLRGYTDKPAMDGWFYCCSKAERGTVRTGILQI